MPYLHLRDCREKFTKFSQISLDFSQQFRYPESFYNGENEGGISEFKKECTQWYSNIDEEDVVPNLSLNKGDVKLTKSVRVTPEWIDSPLDSRFSYFRIPRSSVVVLTPEDSIKPYEGVIMKYESQIVYRLFGAYEIE